MQDDLKLWQSDHLLEVEQAGKGHRRLIKWHVAEEAPIALVYNGQNYAVMLASPQDLVDFAYGFSLSEGIIDAAQDIKAIEIKEKSQGIDVRITLSDERLERFQVRQSRRVLVGNSSCGLCGIDSIEALFQDPQLVADTPAELTREKVAAAVGAFGQMQPLKQRTRSVHGAAWVDEAGDILFVREDVGRHNALDKLIGAMLQQNSDVTGGYALVSSRASFEMVFKAIRAKMLGLVCLSAPTALAIRTAKAANLTLCNWSADGLVLL